MHAFILRLHQEVVFDVLDPAKPSVGVSVHEGVPKLSKHVVEEAKNADELLQIFNSAPPSPPAPGPQTVSPDPLCRNLAIQ